MNRIDLCVETEEVRYTTMVDMREEESSAVIRARVERVLKFNGSGSKAENIGLTVR